MAAIGIKYEIRETLDGGLQITHFGGIQNAVNNPLQELTYISHLIELSNVIKNEYVIHEY